MRARLEILEEEFHRQEKEASIAESKLRTLTKEY
jgi:hypothetical protein